MTRQQKRKELRDVIKSLAKAEKTKEYKEMHSYFDTLGKDDLILLKDNAHPDPKAQALYLRHLNNMKYLISLESRRDLLLGVGEKDVNLV